MRTAAVRPPISLGAAMVAADRPSEACEREARGGGGGADENAGIAAGEPLRFGTDRRKAVAAKIL